MEGDYNMNIFIKTTIVTTAIFAIGIIIGLWLGQEKVSVFESELTSLRDSIENTELQFLFLDVLGSNVSCTYLLKQANDLSAESENLAKQIESYETSDKIDESSFKQLKSSYTTLLIKDWLTLEKIKKTCNATYATVLYFYSDNNCSRCSEQAVVLSYLKQKLGENIMTFAIDGNIELNVISALREAYSIDVFPTLIINGGVHKGYVNLSQTKEILCDYNKNLTIC